MKIIKKIKNYSKKIIIPSTEEIKNHKEFLKKILKEISFNFFFHYKVY